MAEWGYARVSTNSQDPTTQLQALRQAGIAEDRILVDHASGVNESRPGLDKLLESVQPGDRITVVKLDRFGRSLPHLLATVERLNHRDIQFRSLTESIDTRSAGGKLVFTVLAAVAEFERDRIRERTSMTLATKKAQGVRLGRPTAFSPEQARMAVDMSQAGISQEQISRTIGIPRATVGRLLRGEISSVIIPEHADYELSLWGEKKEDQLV